MRATLHIRNPFLCTVKSVGPVFLALMSTHKHDLATGATVLYTQPLFMYHDVPNRVEH